ncbi:MAG: RNA polymerase sigma factor [bacterium]|nr:RNA polymerase sigma factor [bacterium]
MAYLDNKPVKDRLVGGRPLAEAKDEAILTASLRNPNLFGVLVDRYQDAFMRSAQRVVKTREDAEDIVQEAFAKIYKNAKKFKKQEGIEFKSWAYKVLVNTSYTFYQKLKKKQAVSMEFFETYKYDIMDEKENIKGDLETKEIIGKVLLELPDELKRIVEMHYLKDLSYETISKQEKLSIPAIKMRLFRGRKLMQKTLEEKELD